jgi:signal transduction histidine kinase
MKILGMQSLSARLSWLIVSALLLVQLSLYVLIYWEEEALLFEGQSEERIDRIISVLKILESDNVTGDKSIILEAASDDDFSMFLEQERLAVNQSLEPRFVEQLEVLNQEVGREGHLILLREWAEQKNISFEQMQDWFGEEWEMLILAGLPLQDGSWLYAVLYDPWGAFLPILFGELLLWLPMCLVIILMVIFSVRHVTRPLAKLAERTQRFGRGEKFTPLPITGAQEIRQATEAFNNMAQRLESHVNDRQQMLSAISHDLRSPLTAMRIQAEFIAETEVQTSVINSIDEMQQMLTSVLHFTRDDAQTERVTAVNVTKLLESLVDQYQKQNESVSLVSSDSMQDIVLKTRPLALKRALRNLIENALKYGGTAALSCQRHKSAIAIIIEDEGSGIPEQAMERVFDPFVQLDAARSENRSGVGMGLSVARALLRASGGDVTLENSREKHKGLRVVAKLPMR